jgi:hypothetical protein
MMKKDKLKMWCCIDQKGSFMPYTLEDNEANSMFTVGAETDRSRFRKAGFKCVPVDVVIQEREGEGDE